MKKHLVYILFICFGYICSAQVENVQINHPVYSYLLHNETKGILEHFSLSKLPLQRMEIVSALKIIRQNAAKLSKNEISVLEEFENEFEIVQRKNAVVFYSPSDSTQVLSSRLISNDEKFIYHYKDSGTSVRIEPLASFNMIVQFENGSKRNVQLGQAGGRLYGTISNSLGYFFQATNGAVLSGVRALAMEDNKLRQNIKFADLNSDFDFSESHVQYQKSWFIANYGREYRRIGAGIMQNVFMSDYCPPVDGFSVGAKFSNFEYSYFHGSLLAYYKDSISVGFNAVMPQKYLVMHRFALKPSWGEIAFTELLTYSKRNIDLTYLNPLSFFKNLEHALRDRDNSVMGLDATVRIFPKVQVKGSFLLDDIIFGELGTGYWSNKFASNIAVLCNFPDELTWGFEIARVEPYCYSHFDSLNALTNDNIQFTGNILPNSDKYTFFLQWLYGGRYPVVFALSYSRHGENEYDDEGNLIKNVGGDPMQSRREKDAYYVKFLDGKRVNIVSAQLQLGYEIFRGLNVQGFYRLELYNNSPIHYFNLGLRIYDF